MSSSRAAGGRLLALALGLGAAGACSSDAAQLVPIVEVPSSDSDAYPYAAIDTWELSVARSGDLEPIALVSDAIGKALVLSDVAYGSDLVVHLSGRSGGSELAYGKTCSFSLERDEQAEPRLYFSRIVRWASGPELAAARAGRVMGVTLEDSGLGLFWSGEDGGSIDVLDATSLEGGGGGQALEGLLLARSGASATPFGDRILVVGGVDGDGDAVAMVEQVLPTEATANNQVLQVAGPGLVDHQSIALEDGSVLVTGGRVQETPAGAFVHREAATLFSLLEGELVQRELQPGLSIPRSRHSMTRLGNEVGADILVIGGLDASGQSVAQAELFRPLQGAFETVTTALLAIPRQEHKSVRLPGGFVLVIGGFTIDGTGAAVPVRELELYDPVQGVFRPAGSLPSGAGITGLSVTELPDGRFLLAGGEDIDGEAVKTALIARFDPIAGAVDLTPTASLAEARSHHAAVVLCDGTVLITGGGAGASANTERYNPPSVGRR